VKQAKYLRWFLSVALLIVVWFHAHWSVALSLSLLAFTVEAQTQLWVREAKLLTDILNSTVPK
jgi:hypothetical protein